jgi:hypothetical protein
MGADRPRYAEASGGTIEVVDLVARDPRRAGCRLKVTRNVSARRR